MQKFTGPIPGENYTSDTKNYPWHRPPEYTDLDKAIEAAGEKLLSEDSATGVLTMLEMGMDVATLTDMFLTSGIGAGKWTPDYAILMAGPVSHIICLMAEGYDIEYDLGLEDTEKPVTSAFLKAVREDGEKIKTLKDNIPIEEVQEQAQQSLGGFMGMAKTQGEM